MYLQVSQFEADAFTRAWAKTTDKVVRRRCLRIFGQDIRDKARRAIKPSKPRRDGSFKSSSVGSPPFYRARPGVTRANSPFVGSKNFLYVYDDQRQSVVVGPRLWRRRATPTPNVLEYGGTTKYDPSQATRWRERKIGSGGELRIAGHALGRDKRGRGLSQRGGTKVVRDTNLGDVWVAYGTIRTAAQARRANRIQAMLFLKSAEAPRRGTRTARVGARPFIRPTLSKYIASDKPAKVLARVMASRAASGSRNLRRRR